MSWTGKYAKMIEEALLELDLDDGITKEEIKSYIEKTYGGTKMLGSKFKVNLKTFENSLKKGIATKMLTKRGDRYEVTLPEGPGYWIPPPGSNLPILYDDGTC